MLANNWENKDIVSYTQKHFDVIAIDVLGHRQVTDSNGNKLPEKIYTAQQKVNFTPTLHFYDKQGKLAFKLTGYRSPYQFKAALEYVAGNHHNNETFSEYYSRAESAYNFGDQAINTHPNIQLTTTPIKLLAKGKPLLLLFEQSRCHACDILHGGPLQNELIIQRLQKFNAVQLDIKRDQSIITPAGQHTTSRVWAKQLHLDYTPTLMFFDEQGKEIIRIDSVVWFYRLNNVLDYVLTKSYRQFPNFQHWRSRPKEADNGF